MYTYLVTSIQAALATLVPVLALACLPAATACSACPERGPAALRVDPAFTPEQRQAIYDAIDAWDVQAGLRMSVSDWGDENSIPIMRVDSLVEEGKLGKTHYETVEREHDRIMLAGTGTFASGTRVDQFDFGTTARHELGHLLMGVGIYDPGCDGQGHTNDVDALMYAHGNVDGSSKPITAQDVDRVLAVIDKAW